MKLFLKTGLVLPAALAVLALLLAASAPRESYAEIDYVPLAPIEGTVNASGKTNLSTYLTGIFKVGVAGAGALAFLMIVWGGFTYFSTDVITGKEEGKARIQRALGGLLLALTSYIILNTINPKLVELDLYFGAPARQEGRFSAPDVNSPGYYADLDRTIAEINQNLTETKTRAGALETLAGELAAQKDALHNAMENGDFSQIDKFNELGTRINALYGEAQAIRDYNTALDIFKADKQKAFENLLTKSNVVATPQIAMQVESINNTVANRVQKLEEDAVKAPLKKAQIDGWIQDMRKQADDTQLAIAQEAVNRSNVNVPKNIMDQAYRQQQADLGRAGGDTAKIAAINQRYTTFVGAVQAKCSGTTSSCRNYDPATNPANRR